MVLLEVAVSACLMLNVSPSVAKKCEKIVVKECKEKKSYKDCFEKISPQVNVLMKKQYAKACILQ